MKAPSLIALLLSFLCLQHFRKMNTSDLIQNIINYKVNLKAETFNK